MLILVSHFFFLSCTLSITLSFLFLCLFHSLSLCTSYLCVSLSLSLRFPAGQQLVTKLVTAPMTCGAVMVPTTMFMYNPFAQQQGQAQAITLQQQQQGQPQADSQTQASQGQVTQTGIPQQTQQQAQFLQVNSRGQQSLADGGARKRKRHMPSVREWGCFSIITSYHMSSQSAVV